MPLNAEARRNFGGLPSGLYFGLDIGQARKSGSGLAGLVRAIRREVHPTPKLSILAHSLGAEVLLAGLQLLAQDGGRVVDTAMMAQAAVPPSYLMKGKNPIPRYLYYSRGTGDSEERIENTKEYEDWGRYADASEAVALEGGIPALYTFYSRADSILADLYPWSGQPLALGLNYADGLGELLPPHRQIDTTPGAFERRCLKCGIGSHSAYIESSPQITYGVFQDLARLLNR
jgi:pimeloyl-ACP methyl ester carboxylesterase